MDSRHESLKEGFINHVITTINTYVMDNLDLLVTNTNLRTEIVDVCKNIYSYLDIDVDTDNILSRHNLLSTDVVLFPCIPDPEANKILDEDHFNKLLQVIKSIKNTALKKKITQDTKLFIDL